MVTVAGWLSSGCHGAGDEESRQRLEMVRSQIEARGGKDPRVLEAMRRIPRHLFVPDDQRASAYSDHPLPIGSGQTISQPYIVAFMTEQLGLKGGERVLEIGTGSGYQAAVLAALARKVYSIEIRKELADGARERLGKLGVANAEIVAGDGYRGWPEEAPFDAIIVTAAPERVPPPLLEQLTPNGRMVIPVGGFYQELKVIDRTPDGFRERSVLPVRFVPFVREGDASSGVPSKKMP